MKILSATRLRPIKAHDSNNQGSNPRVLPAEQKAGIWPFTSRLVPRSRDKVIEAPHKDNFLKESRPFLQPPAIPANKSLDRLFSSGHSKEARLMYAIEEIKTKKAGSLNLDFLEKILCTDSLESSENTLWLGICYRLRGKNPTSVLEPLLAEKRFSRDALVNICAYHAAQMVSPGERPTFNETVHIYLEKLDAHTRVHRTDTFARLVQALLFYRIHEPLQAIQLLEDLYLDERKYSIH
jgi:hypothetical protein